MHQKTNKDKIILRLPDPANIVLDTLDFLEVAIPESLKTLEVELEGRNISLAVWSQLVGEKIYSKDYGLLRRGYVGTHFNVHPESNQRRVGRFFGLCVFNSVANNVPIAPSVLKYVLDEKIEFDDLSKYDGQIHSQLRFLRMMTPAELESKKLKFTITIDDETVPVCLNGDKRDVTKSNLEQFLQKGAETYLITSIEESLKEFSQGFWDILPIELQQSSLTARDLAKLLEGQNRLNVSAWKANTEYYGINPDHEIIGWFWQAVRSFNNYKRLKLYSFITGIEKPSVLPFSLHPKIGISEFFHQEDNSDRVIPHANQAEHRLYLPTYKDYQTLHHHLLNAPDERRFILE